MGSDIKAPQALPYRALTGENPVVLGDRVNGAIMAGYETYGDLEHCSSAKRTSLPGTMFMQLVIDPVVVATLMPGQTGLKGFKVVWGGTDRAFCEEVSGLLSGGEGWRLYGPPQLVCVNSNFTLFQRLVKV